MIRLLTRLATALALVAAPVVVLVGAATPARAADCSAATVPTLSKASTSVFRGTVVRVTKPVIRSQQRVKFVKMAVSTVFKGSASPSTMRIRAAATERVRQGDYFVFVTKDHKQWALVCGGARVASTSNVTQVRSVLGEGNAVHRPTPPPPPRPTLVLQPVEQHAPKRFRQLAAPGAALLIVGLLGLFVVRRRQVS